MKSFTLLFLASFCLSIFSFSQNPQVEFVKAGFRIKTLEPAQAPANGYLACTMSLPAEAGFAPNVNVIVEPFSGSLKEYKKMSVEQLEFLEVEPVKVKQKKGELTFEYEGDMLGPRIVHVFTRVILVDDKVFVATATATPEQWKNHGKQLREVVNSIEGL